MVRGQWTSKERAILEANYTEVSWTTLLELLPWRTQVAIQKAAQRFGLLCGHNQAGGLLRVYSLEETEFLLAIVRWRVAHNGSLPSLLDGLHIAKSLGWALAQ